MDSKHGAVKIIAADNLLKPSIDEAGGKLVVIDFTAAWCGPCQKIAPVFAKFSMDYPAAVFLKVDVDQCKQSAEKYAVSAMPTFVFLKGGVPIDKLSGADPNALKEMIKKHLGAEADGVASDTGVPGQLDLATFISKTGCNCLNESDDNPHTNCLTKDDKILESDCDEQLLLRVEFNQAVKLHSLRFKAPTTCTDGTSGPKRVKLFINQPSQIDFDSAEQMAAVQELDLSPADIISTEDGGGALMALRYVKFQNVQNMTIFIVNNQNNDDVTALEYLQIIGMPVESTNMADFKRMAGKAGESH